MENVYFYQAALNILEGLKMMGMELDEANFKDTPGRMERAYCEIFEGVVNTEENIELILSKAFPSEGHNDMIIEKGISAFSMCPHHLLPVEYKVAIAYIPDPKGEVLGISKLARLAQLLAKKPSLQEDYTQQILKALERIKPHGVAVVVNGRHMCMRMRGVKNINGSVITSAVSGCFKDDSQCRAEFMSLVTKEIEF